jgi:flagellar hook protein FlgE
MFSFHIPVAALEKQQSRLELLGENLANINTPGYKLRRMTFVETLGTVTGITQTQFKQGAITYTGNVTDLAITGDSFFVIKKGEEQVYTRAGAFNINCEGKLVNSDGYVVQGYMEDLSDTGATRGSSSIGDVVIDSNLIMAAQATENVWLSGNFNAGLESVAEVWSSGTQYVEKAYLTSGEITTPLTVVSGDNDQFTITLDPKYTDTQTEVITLSEGDYADLDAIVAEINSQIANNENLNGNVEAVNSDGSLKIRATDGLSDTVLTLEAGENDVLAALGFTDGISATSGVAATEDTELNDLLQVTADMIDGDILNISGKNAIGEGISADFCFGASLDGITMGDLLAIINESWDEYSTAEISDGTILLTDLVQGDSETSISLTASSENVGQITVPSFKNETAGFTGRVSTSAVVYDSLGKSHNLTIDFIKTDDDSTWTWTITGSDDEEIVHGNSGRILFDANGDFMSFAYDNGVDSVLINPGNGADDVNLRICCEPSGGFTGVSQFDTVSTMHVRDQDGRQSETLNDFHIESDGSVMGTFGTGQELKLAQIALAQFNDPAGLEKIGGSNYVATDESGIAHIGTTESQKAVIEPSSLELSTVDLADQFTKMIETQRAYQAASKVISTFEEIFEQTTQLKR